MPRWIPDDSRVAQGEHIGRRLYAEPKLSGAPDQKPFHGLDISNFMETRGRDFSCDRLGQSSVDNNVIGYLMERCHQHSAERGLPFNGWIYATAKKLAENNGWETVASGVRSKGESNEDLPWDDTKINENRFHAHLVMPEAMAPRMFAMEARERFVRVGQVHRITPGRREMVEGDL